MAYNQEIKDYAKELYLKIGKDGGHQYSNYEIAKEISAKFRNLRKNPDESTIRSWVTKKEGVTGKCWRDVWEDGQRVGMACVVSEVHKHVSSEEEIELQVDAVMRSRALRALRLCEGPDAKLERGVCLSRDELNQVRVSELIWENLALEDKSVDSGRVDLFLRSLKRGLE